MDEAGPAADPNRTFDSFFGQALINNAGSVAYIGKLAGANTVIPYSKEGCKPKLAIRSYPVKERYGIIWAWFSPD